MGPGPMIVISLLGKPWQGKIVFTPGRRQACQSRKPRILARMGYDTSSAKGSRHHLVQNVAMAFWKDTMFCHLVSQYMFGRQRGSGYLW